MAATEDTATFTFELNDDGVSSTANATASSLEQLRERIQGGVAELRNMQKALRNMSGAAQVNIGTVRELKDRIAAQKAAVAQAQSSYIKLGGTFKETSRGASDAAGGLRNLLEQARGAPGPLGGFASKLGNVTSMLGGARAGAIAGAAAFAALAVAAAVAVSALLKYGIAQADARRSELLQLEGLTKIRNFMGGFAVGLTRGADSAGFLQAQIDRVSSTVAIGRSKVAGYADQLYRMGLRAGNLQQALEGVAITASTQGDGQAQIFANVAAGAALTGQSVRRLADDVRARLGGIAKAQLLSLSVQSEKLRENFGMLFAKLKIDRLLSGIASLTELFAQSTATGRALQAIMSAMLQPLTDGLAELTPLAKRFFQGMVLGSLLIAIGILKLRNLWREAFGKEARGGIDGATVALYAGAAAVGALAGAMAALAIWTVAATWPLLLGVAAVTAFGAAVYQAYKLWEEVDWRGLGTSIVQGIVNGLKGGATWVWEAMKNLAGGAVRAFEQVFDMHSPSRLMQRRAINIPRGAALGVDDGRPQFNAAMGRLGESDAFSRAAAPLATGMGNAAAEGAGKAAAPGGGGGAARIDIHNEINITATSNEPAAFGAAVRDAIKQTLEGIAIEIGAAKQRA